MKEENYYDILGVDEDADPGTIEAAYWELLRKYHPDNYKGPDSKAKIKQLNIAYDVLSSPQKRAEYDARMETSSTVPAMAEPVAAPSQPQAPAQKTRVWSIAAFVIILAIVGGAAYWFWGNTSGSAAGGPAIGQPAIDFELKDLKGQTVSLSSLKGKAVMINFWASWCPPCREEMPDIENAYKDYKDQGLVVLAVNIQEDNGTASDFVQKLGLTFPVVLDTAGNVSEKYHVYSLPTSYFIDRDGIVRDLNIGRMDRKTIDAKVKKIL